MENSAGFVAINARVAIFSGQRNEQRDGSLFNLTVGSGVVTDNTVSGTEAVMHFYGFTDLTVANNVV